jgi:multidrug efflux system outer membrane protein
MAGRLAPRLLVFAAAGLGAAMGIASCSVGPNYSRPPGGAPDRFKSATTQPASLPQLGQNWWTLFGDEKLNELEELATAGNFDLKAAIARVAEARAASNVVRAGFLPTLNFNPSMTRARTSGNLGGGRTGSGNLTNNLFQLPLDASYEVDVWGKVRRSYEAATAQYHASEADAAVIRLTLQADVAVGYLTLRSLDSQERILVRTIEQFREAVRLTEKQQAVGIVDKTAVVQARSQLDSTVPLLQEVRRQRADQEHALAVLLGRPPSELSLAANPLIPPPPPIPAGLPADLLLRRPDVAEAEQNLVAANAQIGVAVAAFLPNVQLTGSVGYESSYVRNLLSWNSRTWSFGPSASIPLFEGGALLAGLEQTRARYEELLAGYRGVIVGAFRDVEDSLTDIELRAEEAESLAKAVASASEYRALAEEQYRKGLATYLVVVDAYRTLLTNELAAAQVLNQRMIATVQLIKAVGGGWDSRSPSSQPD